MEQVNNGINNNEQDAKNESSDDSKNSGPDSSFPTPPSESPKNRLQQNQMSSQGYYPRKNSLLNGDIGSPPPYSDDGMGFQNKQDDSLLSPNSPGSFQTGLMAPPGLIKTPVDDSHFGRVSSPNQLAESIQKNTSSNQEMSWAPEDRVVNEIWDEKLKSQDSSLKVPSLLPKFLEDGLDSTPPRTARSFSFSVGGLLGDSQMSDSNFLSTGGNHEFARSKSISYEHSHSNEENDIFEGFTSMSLTQRASIATSDIWNPVSTETVRPNFAPLYHRRASTQPASNPNWGDVGEVMDPVVNEGNIMMSQEQIDRYREQRKFTHAPTLMTEYIQRFNMAQSSDGHLGVPNDPNVRRHSVSSPVLDARKIQKSQPIPKIEVYESPKPLIDNINDYFGNTEARAKAWAQAGKNLQSASRSSSSSSTVVDHSITRNWPIYVVEFKAGRTDFFFLPEGLDVNIGDLVIVEADRGKDLGKVVDNSIRSMDELMQFKQKMEAKMPELYNGNNTIVPKCIYRKAQPSETSMLLVKSEDEQKAMAACRQKIVDRNLPMEVVDTEYQWDRRKLTFYFVSESRIDFRELVRELFKIYKTRIWM